MRQSQSFRSRFMHSLRAKIMLGVITPLAFILAALVLLEQKRHEAADLRHLSLLASHSAKLVKHEFRHEMLEGDFTRIQESLDTIAESDSFRVVYFLDTRGRVVFSAKGESTPTQLDNTQPGCLPCHRLPPEDRPQSVVVTNQDGERVFRTMLPIENSSACARCHNPEQPILGELLADISMAPLEAPITASFRTGLMWSGGTILVTVLSIAFAMNKLVIRNLEGIAKNLKRFADGERGVRLRLQRSDEIGLLSKAFDDMAQSIEQQEEVNRALSKNLQQHSERRRQLLEKLIVVQEDERKRVARDLHDDLGQGLASIALGLTNFERLLANEPEKAKAQIRKVRNQIDDLTDHMHDMIVDLRPSVLDHLGLEPALRAFGEPMLQEAGAKLLITNDLEHRLPMEIETAIFRTFQEVLTNIVRHARANRVNVRLTMRDGAFEGEVTDDGCGFDVDKIYASGSANKGFGLLGMDERIALCGGTLTISSKPEFGTKIEIKIPVLGAET